MLLKRKKKREHYLGLKVESVFVSVDFLATLFCVKLITPPNLKRLFGSEVHYICFYSGDWRWGRVYLYVFTIISFPLFYGVSNLIV